MLWMNGHHVLSTCVRTGIGPEWSRHTDTSGKYIEGLVLYLIVALVMLCFGRTVSVGETIHYILWDIGHSEEFLSE